MQNLIHYSWKTFCKSYELQLVVLLCISIANRVCKSCYHSFTCLLAFLCEYSCQSPVAPTTSIPRGISGDKLPLAALLQGCCLCPLLSPATTLRVSGTLQMQVEMSSSCIHRCSETQRPCTTVLYLRMPMRGIPKSHFYLVIWGTPLKKINHR